MKVNEIWVIISTTYFTNKIYGFTSRLKAEKYIEYKLKKIGWSKKIQKENMTIYVENANGEDIYANKVIMLKKQ